ncbi:nucleotidyltransferase domain-containing protein [candidate division KSB1 bacterium]|nr:nucleotidyltransferase domain-containing protein [candidate division KSB1 bacterium]
MLSESDKNIIIKFAQKYNVSAIYLFGSSLNANAQARDIDLGVQGLRQIFKQVENWSPSGSHQKQNFPNG